ncbi:SH3 domain-binding protein 5-like isoform X2 [Oncorhynchus keta]|uniref:SH3 domain-binding protein 5-like isoform X2 n=1 Tax=Oncorhynchus keta TaxID=8018 RepID=UPI00227BF29D|nr:SH3 domain-binding protein 5-like isoform X2 [Oncorhynchus keta]
MEPGSSRESPSGSGGPEVAGLREETPGEEAEDGDNCILKGGGDGGNENTLDRMKAECKDDAVTGKNIEDTDEDKFEEELDPRIQEELEHLNQASDEINKLELQLDDARSSYRRILTDSARKLNAQGSQLGTCIEKARPYYEARRLTKEAQQETQKAALRYERAVSMHTAAREMVYVAEQGLLADRNTLDPTWQEMLNHATSKVNEAEEERLRSEREHQRVTQLCQEAEQRVQTLQKSLKRVIVKSKPYFELKAQFNHILEEHKANVVQLEERVAKVKMRYSVALRNLEQISEQIHAQRGRVRATRAHLVACGGRSSPVGAEAEVKAAVGVQVGGACGGGGGLDEKDWADGEKTRQWVERHREQGWGHRERGEAGSDSMSDMSLQTIASDLEKCDSVGHLGDLSDVSSLMGEDWERERDQSFMAENRDRDGNPRAEERVVRGVSSLMGKEKEREMDQSFMAENRDRDGKPRAEERVVRDVSSLMGKERERDQSFMAENRDRDGNPRAEERVVRDVSSLMGKESEMSLIAEIRDGNPRAEERVLRDVVIPTPRQDRLEEVRGAIRRERQESFVKQHHRSVSL